MSEEKTPVRRAVIDIGTNSVKLLVVDVKGDRIDPIWEGGEQTRLGAGFYESRHLQSAAIERTLKAVAAYHARAGELGASTVRVVATSAVRDAINGGDLTNAIRDLIGVSVECLSGDCEAEWAFRGVMTNRLLADRPALIVDLGGGSTEFIVGDGKELLWRASFELGTVRWLERMGPGDPPKLEELRSCRESVAEYMRCNVMPRLGPSLELVRRREPVLVGTGGAVGILTRMHLEMEDFVRERIEATRLRAMDVAAWVDRLWSLPFAARGEIAGLPPERADVMLMGVCILEGVMQQCGFSVLQPSARGLRFAALMD